MEQATDHPLVGPILRTDGMVSQFNAILPQYVSAQIDELRESCEALFGPRFSLFLAGSLALALRANSLEEFRLEGDRSDVDLFIVIDTPQVHERREDSEEPALTLAIRAAVSRLLIFDMASVADPRVGSVLSPKVIMASIVRGVLRFEIGVLNVFRVSSLLARGQSFITAYGLERSYRISIEEERLTEGGYRWSCFVSPYIDDDFVLTDLHHCFVFGGFLLDRLGLSEERLRFIHCVVVATGGGLALRRRDNLLEYFQQRVPKTLRRIYRAD